MSFASKATAKRLVTAGEAVRLLEQNPQRLAIIIQNLGPGVAWVNTGKPDAIKDGFKLEVGQTLEDVERCIVHWGEWWAIADLANTDLMVQERV